jgi:hypothetical protein
MRCNTEAGCSFNRDGQGSSLVGPPACTLLSTGPLMVQHQHAHPSVFRRFLDGQSSGGLVLMAVALLAIVTAKSPVSSSYLALFTPISARSASSIGSTTR